MAKQPPTIKLVERSPLHSRIYIYGKNGEIQLTSEIFFDKSNARRAGKQLAKTTGLTFIDTTVPAKAPRKPRVKKAVATKSKGKK